MRFALIALVIGLALSSGAPAGAVESSSCVSQPTATRPARAGCGEALGLLGATGVSVSPDGRWIDVAASTSGAIATFAAEGDQVRQVGCVSDTGGDGRDGTDGACVDAHALRGAKGVVASPDGRHVYAAAVRSGAVTAYIRSDTGTLTQVQCVKDSALESRCDDGRALGGARDAAISSDGRHVYVAAGAGAVATFARDAATGRLAQTGCVSATGNDGACDDGTGLYGATAVDVAPGGAHVYVAAARSGAVTTFRRDPSTGALRQTGCSIGEAPRGATACRRVPSVTGARSLVVAADGRRVAVAGSRAVTVLRRAPEDGTLSFARCAASLYEGRCASRRGVDGAFSAALLQDRLIVGASASVLALPAALAGPGACAGRPSRCAPSPALDVVRDLAFSPRGDMAYAVSSRHHALTVLDLTGARSG